MIESLLILCRRTAASNEAVDLRERWEQYLAQKQENRYVDDKAGFLREREQWGKSFAKWSKHMKRNGGIRK